MRRLTPWAAFLLCLATASPAWAETSVVVLGMRSIEGDDAVATALTDTLRAAATTVDNWRVEERGPTMSQMSMAHGCDEIDAHCLHDIAGGLEVDVIIYGSVRRTSTRDNYDYSLTLSLYDNEAGAIDKSITEKVLRANVEAGALATQASELIGKLTGRATRVELGALRIMLNITDSAEVTIDGQPAGTAAGGSFVLEGVAPGEHTLAVQAQGYEPFETGFSVTAGDPTRVAANLTPIDGGAAPPPITAGASYEGIGGEPPRGGLPSWLPWTLIGAGGLGLAGAVISWVWIDSINEDALFQQYSGVVHNDNLSREANGQAKFTDVCERAVDDRWVPNDASFPADDLSEVQSMCNTGGALEIAQWVFLGVAVIGGGLGTYLLVTQPSGDVAAAEPSRLSLQPVVGRSGGHLTATLRF